MEFGREYFIPKPFDRRVFVRASSAVAAAAIKDGAARKIIDIGEYTRALEKKVEKLMS